MSRDPEHDWERVGPYVMHESNAYAKLAGQLGQKTPYGHANTLDDLRKLGTYLVLTPDETVEYLRPHRDKNHMVVATLTGGLDPALSWESLELLANEVVPALQGAEATTSA